MRYKELEDEFFSTYDEAMLQTNLPLLERLVAKYLTKEIFLMFRPLIERGSRMCVKGYRETLT